MSPAYSEVWCPPLSALWGVWLQSGLSWSHPLPDTQTWQFSAVSFEEQWSIVGAGQAGWELPWEADAHSGPREA
jgi:hypothetical protein